MTEETKAAEPQGLFIPYPTLYKFTNDTQSPELDQLLAMFYEGVYGNRIGISKVFNLATEEEELVLVGLEVLENGQVDMGSFYPLARILKAEEAPYFLSPKGDGTYYDPRDAAQASEAQDNLRDDALADEIVTGAEVVKH